MKQYKMTERQKTILICILKGKSHKEVGKLTNNTKRSIDQAVYKLRKKMGVGFRSSLRNFIYRNVLGLRRITNDGKIPMSTQIRF